MGSVAYKTPDRYGFMRQGRFIKGKRCYVFYRDTVNANITMWVSPAQTSEGYIVERSERVGEMDFENKIVAQFPTAVEAKKWVNVEYAHMFK